MLLKDRVIFLTGASTALGRDCGLAYAREGAKVIVFASVFLVSDQARFVTGHIMHVSGGAEIGYRR